MTDDSIFLRREDGTLSAMRNEPYESEDLLQSLLAQHPELLAGSQLDPRSPRRWVLIKREMGVPDTDAEASRWSIDHLFLDQDAIPTLVEVKRASDTRIRREVLGQMLDYAANAVVYWPVERVKSALEARCDAEQIDVADALREVLDDDQHVDDYWQQVKTNLQAGRVRMVFVADDIPPELQRIIEFLNEQMDPATVIGIAIRQYRAPGFQTLVPRVIGLTAESQARKATTSSPRWTEATFLDDTRSLLDDAQVELLMRVLRRCQELGCTITWGRGKKASFLVAHSNTHGKNIIDLNSRGTLTFHFGDVSTDEANQELVAWIERTYERLTGQPGSNPRWWSIPIEGWQDHTDILIGELEVLFSS